MTNERFNAVWEPRVGCEATEILRTRSRLALTGFAALAFIIVMGIILNSPWYYIVTLPIVGAYLIGFTVLLRRSNRRLAAALSQHLGVTISSKNVPPVRNVRRFDEAVSDLREGRRPRRKSLLGGFVRTELPPKP